MVTTTCTAEGCHVRIWTQAFPHLCRKHRLHHKPSKCCGDPHCTYGERHA